MSDNPKFNEIELFKGKSLADVFKDIYKNTKDKDSQINTLIQQLSPLVQSISDAIQVIPLIRDYLETGVKNNEHLVKMAAVVQRSMAAKTSGGQGDNDDFIIPEHELEELKKNIKGIQNSSDNLVIDLTQSNITGSNLNV